MTKSKTEKLQIKILDLGCGKKRDQVVSVLTILIGMMLTLYMIWTF